jgi:hypothetical protein
MTPSRNSHMALRTARSHWSVRRWGRMLRRPRRDDAYFGDGESVCGGSIGAMSGSSMFVSPSVEANSSFLRGDLALEIANRNGQRGPSRATPGTKAAHGEWPEATAPDEPDGSADERSGYVGHVRAGVDRFCLPAGHWS